ncbi:hypothetical protein EZS27_021066 [termite gut metagenome]|uniref:Arm DNA-binding domain-containing protein n=1 Tax=termite gut metagenome TaxID=433724 RepID=A0A5J4RBZ8_9ZZZZ
MEGKAIFLLISFVFSFFVVTFAADNMKLVVMANKVKKQAKVKEPIRIRYKAISAGNQSIYLDYYYNGKREYEFLKLLSGS